VRVVGPPFVVELHGPLIEGVSKVGGIASSCEGNKEILGGSDGAGGECDGATYEAVAGKGQRDHEWQGQDRMAQRVLEGAGRGSRAQKGYGDPSEPEHLAQAVAEGPCLGGVSGAEIPAGGAGGEALNGPHSVGEAREGAA